MTLKRANRLRSGERLRVSADGLSRHGLPGDPRVGEYVSQFESPVHGRMVIVHLDDRGNHGFRLDEVEAVDE